MYLIKIWVWGQLWKRTPPLIKESANSRSSELQELADYFIRGGLCAADPARGAVSQFPQPTCYCRHAMAVGEPDLEQLDSLCSWPSSRSTRFSLGRFSNRLDRRVGWGPWLGSLCSWPGSLFIRRSSAQWVGNLKRSPNIQGDGKCKENTKTSTKSIQLAVHMWICSIRVE